MKNGLLFRIISYPVGIYSSGQTNSLFLSTTKVYSSLANLRVSKRQTMLKIAVAGKLGACMCMRIYKKCSNSFLFILSPYLRGPNERGGLN